MSVTTYQCIKIKDKQSIDAKLDELRQDSNDVHYILFKYVQGQKETLEMVDSGSAPEYEDIEKFLKDEICFVIWRVRAGDDRSVRTKYVFIQWVPECAKQIARVMAGPHGSALRDAMGYVHVTIQARNDLEINKDLVKEKIKQAGGARYDQTERFGKDVE